MENEEKPISLWNCYRCCNHTTNVVKGWHNKINNMLGKSHRKIRDVIECMKKEVDNTACSLINRTELSMAGKQSKTTYLKGWGN